MGVKGLILLQPMSELYPTHHAPITLWVLMSRQRGLMFPDDYVRISITQYVMQ